MCNLNSTTVVTKNVQDSYLPTASESEKFKGRISQSTVLCISARARHNMLFLTTLGNKNLPK
jgi:hypothetical protein